MDSENYVCDRCGYVMPDQETGILAELIDEPRTRSYNWVSFIIPKSKPAVKFTRICPDCIPDLRDWVYGEDGMNSFQVEAICSEIKKTFVNVKPKRRWFGVRP